MRQCAGSSQKFSAWKAKPAGCTLPTSLQSRSSSTSSIWEQHWGRGHCAISKDVHHACSWLVGKDFRPRHPRGGACEQQATWARHNPAAHLGAADEDANAAGSPMLRRSAVQHGLPVRAPKPHVHLHRHRHGRVRVQDFSDEELCSATGSSGAGGTRLSWVPAP